MRKRCDIKIIGDVQGVGFRWSAREKCRELGIELLGAENLPDGGVRLSVEGQQKDLETLIAWVHSGPPLARVRHVDVQWST